MIAPEGAVQRYPVAPFTAAMLKVCVLPGHTLLAGPVIAPGVAGGPTSTSDLFPLIPLQFTERTKSVPPVKLVANAIVILLVFAPLTIEQLAGNVHRYDVAFATGFTLYVNVRPPQTCVL